MQNLNALDIKVREDNVDSGLQDFGVSKSNVAVKAYFRNIESHLVRHIEAAYRSRLRSLVD